MGIQFKALAKKGMLVHHTFMGNVVPMALLGKKWCYCCMQIVFCHLCLRVQYPNMIRLLIKCRKKKPNPNPNIAMAQKMYSQPFFWMAFLAHIHIQEWPYSNLVSHSMSLNQTQILLSHKHLRLQTILEKYSQLIFIGWNDHLPSRILVLPYTSRLGTHQLGWWWVL